MSLAESLNNDRLAVYARLRGGFPFPLAGTVYWAGLAAAGLFLPLNTWIIVAFFASGSIFPLALLFGAIFKNPFMKDRSAAGGVLGPALIGMLLFWPMAIAAYQHFPDLAPLILAIGMSIHWPVIGWSYGRVGIYSMHAVIRAALAFWLWTHYPDERTTLLPLSVAAVYLLTVAVIFVDSGRAAARVAKASIA